MISLLILLGLAAHYITYVMTRSTFPPVEHFRGLVFNKLGEGTALGYLLTCVWCVSAYSSMIVVGGAVIFDSVPLPVAVWLAVASISGTMTWVVNDWLQHKDAKVLKDITDPEPAAAESATPRKQSRRGRS